MCMSATYLTVYVIVYFAAVCAHKWNRKSQAKGPNWDSQAKQHSWEESEGVYKQLNPQKGVTRSVYSEHRDRMDQFAPATC
jgi:hypothetical protein